MSPLKGDLPVRYLVPFTCGYCGKEGKRRLGDVNRAARENRPLYCDKTCFGLASRTDTRTPEQKKADKAVYDAKYSAKNQAKRKAQKADWFKRTYDPTKAAVARKARMPYHLEYCRRPEYRAYKQTYDKHYRATKLYGSFAEAALVLSEVETEIDSRIDRYGIYTLNGTLNKSLNRKREYARTHRFQPQIGTLGNPQLDQVGSDATGSRRRRGIPGAGNPPHGQDATPGCLSVQAFDSRRPHLLLGEMTNGASAPTSHSAGTPRNEGEAS